MGAIRYRALADLRRDWKTVAGVALLLGLVGTVVLTALAGARRSSSALERFREEALAGDATIFYSDPSPLEEVARLPQVEAVGRMVIPFFAPLTPDDAGDFLLVTTPGGFLTDVDRVRVLDGRLPAADRVDELAVNENLAAALDVSLGQELTLRSFSVEQFASGEGFGAGPQGPTIAVRVVGVVRSTFDVSGELTGDRPSGYLSPAFFRAHGDEVASFDGLSRIRLRNGPADVHDFGEAVAPIFADDPEFALAPDSTDVARLEDSIEVIAIGLRLFAAAAAITGMMAFAQVVSLALARLHADGFVLAGLGMTRWHRVGSALLTLTPGLLIGPGLAIVGAALASPLMPIDVARRAEPDPGTSVDGLVLGLGGIALLVVAISVGLVAAWRTTRRVRVGMFTPDRGPSASAMARAIARTRLPVPLTTGAHLAFHGGSGRTAVPVRSGLVGAVLGAASLVGVLVFISSQDGLASTPSLYGWNWDASVVGLDADSSADLVDRVDAELGDDPAFADLGVVRVSHAVVQRTYLHVLGFSGVKGSIEPTVLRGRSPADPSEVALGTATLHALGLSIGDRLEVPGVDGPITLDVVGQVVIPSLDTDAIADEGAVMTGEGADRLATTQSSFDLLLKWTPDADSSAARQQLAELGEVVTDKPPSDVANLERVTAIPRALAVFLGGLAMLAVGHAVVVTVRRRGRDLAVLKVLGLRPRQVAATVAWQATLLIGAGLVLGAPLGVVAGFWTWSVVTSAMGLGNQPEVPVAVVAAAIPVALAMAGLVALLPARAAARTSPATALRLE